VLTNGSVYASTIPLSGGTTAFSISNLPAGTNDVTVVYSGDGNFLSSSNTLFQVIIAPVLDQPSTLTLTNNGDGTITLTLQGTPGVQYVLQATEDLLSGNWINISTNIAPTNGIWTYSESTAANPQRFYRLAKMAALPASIDLPIAVSITNNGNGTVSVKVQGSPETKYVTQATDNPVSGPWINIATNTTAANGSSTYTESTAGHPVRFYRAFHLQ
jgi:hypothetical protein